MRDGDDSALVKRILEAYRASGIPAKQYCGKVLVCREDGWDAIDLRQLESTLSDEIESLKQAVKVAVTEIFARKQASASLYFDFDTYCGLFLREDDFLKLGFDEQKARLYTSVAQRLHYNKQLLE